ncbi:MAG: dTMP kinase [Candidatus Omnitrophica bacterium]|nr:dTMP kinase [Candidatus Omnitrophota bacterium]
MEKSMKGKFITFEGSEGSGKSTQIELTCKHLKANKKQILFVREPGGVKISEKIRDILLDVKNTNMSDECETLLYMAARAQLVKEVILPALRQGKIVLCDRFLDSTIAYQGYGNGVDVDKIKKIGDFATNSIKPDLTIIFDIDTAKGLSRTSRIKDRIEQRTIAYHKRVRKGYLELAKKESKRIRLITVNKSIEDIQAIVKQHVDKLLKI